MLSKAMNVMCQKNKKQVRNKETGLKFPFRSHPLKKKYLSMTQGKKNHCKKKFIYKKKKEDI